jgi:hypothetical protein
LDNGSKNIKFLLLPDKSEGGASPTAVSTYHINIQPIVIALGACEAKNHGRPGAHIVDAA